MQEPVKPDPCMKCGACCAFYPVALQDADDHPGVPRNLICVDRQSRRFMKGTLASSPRCAALEGVVGTRVKCAIYMTRPGVCREFPWSWENGRGNPLCDRARAIYGLQSISAY
ncbi:MAG: YkgJ family cysteine cluster protein [Desulfotignum sp.]|nr:YkgJ family cysteine cluster protein [Desulfotignum sp.]